MENLVVQDNEGVVVITLKEITDMIGVRHNDSMTKVKKLEDEPSFGVLRKTRITSGPTGGRPTDTYQLTKKQAITAAARLNNTMLMKVIDRLEELEKEKEKPVLPDFNNPVAAARAWADAKESELKALLEIDR